MIVDLDDFCEADNRLDLLHELKEANPLFRVTLFTIPGKGSDEFYGRIPEWCELVPHGWEHPHSRECESWSRFQIEKVLNYCEERRYARGWKSPGWQTSGAIYRVLAERGYWIADHYDNYIPAGTRAHVISPAAGHGLDPDHWHGHIPNVCGNGIEETFPVLLQRVREAESFELISEVV